MHPVIHARYLHHKQSYPYEVTTSQSKGEPPIRSEDAHALGLQDFCRYPDTAEGCVHWLFRTEQDAWTFLTQLPVGRLLPLHETTATRAAPATIQ